MIKTYDELPMVARLIIVIFFGAIVGGIYRIIKFVETKETKTLVFGILALIPPVSFVFWILDIVATVTNGKFTYFVD
jgi:hypothetical protein